MIPCYDGIGHDRDCSCPHCHHEGDSARRTCDHLRIQAADERLDDMTAMVMRLVGEQQTQGMTAVAALRQLGEERDALRARVAALEAQATGQGGCAYCEYDATGKPFADLQAHIETCEHHPLGRALRKVAALEAARDTVLPKDSDEYLLCRGEPESRHPCTIWLRPHTAQTSYQCSRERAKAQELLETSPENSPPAESKLRSGASPQEQNPSTGTASPTLPSAKALRERTEAGAATETVCVSDL